MKIYVLKNHKVWIRIKSLKELNNEIYLKSQIRIELDDFENEKTVYFAIPSLRGMLLMHGYYTTHIESEKSLYHWKNKTLL